MTRRNTSKFGAELFEVPGTPETLPRFVRRVHTLGQFWNCVKTEQNLPSYASRRKFVVDAFRPLIESIEDGTSVEGQKFFPRGSEHDAYTQIREILQKAKSSLLIIDAYMDSTIYTVLSTLDDAVAVRILTSKVPADSGSRARSL